MFTQQTSNQTDSRPQSEIWVHYSRALLPFLHVCDSISTGDSSYFNEVDRLVKVYSCVEDVPFFTPAIVIDREGMPDLICCWHIPGAGWEAGGEGWSVNVCEGERGEINLEGVKALYSSEDMSFIRDYVTKRSKAYWSEPANL